MNPALINYRSAPKYKWFVCLARHPDHVNLNPRRDPRRVWQYECCTGRHSAEDYTFGREHLLEGAEFGDRVYYFESELDTMMFSLRWQ